MKIGPWLLVCLLLAVVPLSADVLRPADTASQPTRPMPTDAVAALQQKGEDLLTAGDYPGAISAFQAELAQKPPSMRCLHGLGLAYWFDKQYTYAAKYLRSAYIAAGSDVPVNLLANTVLAECQAHQPERGILRAVVYLKKHADAPDERAVDVLGYALATLPDNEWLSPAASSARDLYLELEQKLTPPRQGWKRMAGGWTAAADEAAARHHAFTQAITDVQNAQHELQEVQNDTNRRGKATREVVAQNRLAEANTRYTQNSPYPATFDPLPLDPADAAPTTHPVVAPSAPVDIAETVALPTPPTPAATEVTPKAEEAQPQERHATAVAVAPNLVVTAAAAVKDAKKITLVGIDGKTQTAELIRRDDSGKLALLRVVGRPVKFLAVNSDFAGGKVRCFTYDNAGLFDNDADVYNGTCDSVAGAIWNITLDNLPASPGSPVIGNGKLIGIEMATTTSKPASIPTITAKQVLKLLGSDLPADVPNATNPAQAVLRVNVVY